MMLRCFLCYGNSLLRRVRVTMYESYYVLGSAIVTWDNPFLHCNPYGKSWCSTLLGLKVGVEK